MQNWLIKFLKSPKNIGSIAPSSRFLARLMVQDIQKHHKVLELGPGSGVFTKYILNKINHPQQLQLVEIDAEYAQYCQDKFPQINVHHLDLEVFLQNNEEKFDIIISGIPFALIDLQKRQYLFQQIKEKLNKNGRFIMFQYSVLSKKELSEIFNKVEIKSTLINLPPAFVFTCFK